MNDNLYIYLKTRNTLTGLAILLLIAYTFGLVFIEVHVLTIIGSPAIIFFIILLPLPILLFLGLRNDLSTYGGIPEMGKEMYGPDYVRIKPHVEIIRKKIGLNTMVKIYPDHEGKTGVRTYARVAHLFIARADTKKPEPHLLAILAHELVHVLNNDSLKRGIVKTLGYILVVYTLILSLILFQTVPFFLFLILTGVLGLTGLYLYFLPNRIMEKTADGATVFLGYCDGMLSLLSFLAEPPFPFNVFTIHDSPRNRIKNILEIITS